MSQHKDRKFPEEITPGPSYTMPIRHRGSQKRDASHVSTGAIIVLGNKAYSENKTKKVSKKRSPRQVPRLPEMREGEIIPAEPIRSRSERSSRDWLQELEDRHDSAHSTE